VRRDSARRALSWCAERAQERTLLSSETEKHPRDRTFTGLLNTLQDQQGVA